MPILLTMVRRLQVSLRTTTKGVERLNSAVNNGCFNKLEDRFKMTMTPQQYSNSDCSHESLYDLIVSKAWYLKID